MIPNPKNTVRVVLPRGSRHEIFMTWLERVRNFLLWRNYSEEHFGASANVATAQDFKAWAKQKNLLFVNDIRKIK